MDKIRQFHYHFYHHHIKHAQFEFLIAIWTIKLWSVKRYVCVWARKRGSERVEEKDLKWNAIRIALSTDKTVVQFIRMEKVAEQQMFAFHDWYRNTVVDIPISFSFTLAQLPPSPFFYTSQNQSSHLAYLRIIFIYIVFVCVFVWMSVHARARKHV